MEWIKESDKHEEVYKAYFGNYEITIISLKNEYCHAWIKELKGSIVQPSIFRRSYCQTYNSIEEVKEVFLKSFEEYLNENITRWMTIQHDFLKEIKENENVDK